MPAIVRCFQASKVVGSFDLKISMATTMARAPKNVLPKATPIGVKKVSASSINKKEAPQISPAIAYIATQGFFALEPGLVKLFLTHPALDNNKPKDDGRADPKHQ